MPTKSADPVHSRNKLLADLPPADRQRIRSALEPVDLEFGEVLLEPADLIDHVYFPNDSLISLLILVDRRHVLEVGMVGSEGMVGVGLALGIDTTPVRALVQGTGTAMRMKAARFRKELRRCLALQRAVNVYAHSLMVQVSQTAGCNRFHMVEARLARWLLMTRDRVGSDHFRLTQEFLGHMLGVRRAGVTGAAHGLKQRKLIDYSRGHISIINGRALEAAACSCYEKVRDRRIKR